MKTSLFIGAVALSYVVFTHHTPSNEIPVSNGKMPSGTHDGRSYYNYDNPELYFMASDNDKSEAKIIWKYTKNVQEACNKEGAIRGTNDKFDARTVACAYWDNNSCVIITHLKTTTHTLGHEIRHCFQGEWHKSH